MTKEGLSYLSVRKHLLRNVSAEDKGWRSQREGIINFWYCISKSYEGNGLTGSITRRHRSGLGWPQRAWCWNLGLQWGLKASSSSICNWDLTLRSPSREGSAVLEYYVCFGQWCGNKRLTNQAVDLSISLVHNLPSVSAQCCCVARAQNLLLRGICGVSGHPCWSGGWAGWTYRTLQTSAILRFCDFLIKMLCFLVCVVMALLWPKSSMGISISSILLYYPMRHLSNRRYTQLWIFYSHSFCLSRDSGKTK